MPRIYSSSNDPYDFCQKHFPTEEEGLRKYGNVGDGPDGRGNCYGYDAEHPPYEDDELYRCTVCRKALKEIDDYPKP